MKLILNHTHASISSSVLESAFQELIPHIAFIKKEVAKHGYTSPYASLMLPTDQGHTDIVQNIVKKKKLMRPSVLVIIGIGGSNLGTLAVQEALHGKMYNETNPPLKIYYVDTVDSDYIHTIVMFVEKELKKRNKILINVVTKSGSTTETIANFEVFFALLRQYCPQTYSEYIVVTTDYGSPLWQLGQDEKFTLLEVPRRVGGRFSVFSAVGLFPLGMLGFNIADLLLGAKKALEACTSSSYEENYAAITALIIFLQYQQKITIQDMFLFDMKLEGIGKWYRQLIAESLGKEKNYTGDKVEIGVLPTVSLGTTDLHSVGQLYLGGPRDKSTSFISCTKTKYVVRVPNFDQFETCVPKIQGTSYPYLMGSILEGVKKAYTHNKRPFIDIILPECSEYYLGELLQYKMIEVMLLGHLLQINAFDQPNVESYKEETRKILENA